MFWCFQRCRARLPASAGVKPSEHLSAQPEGHPYARNDKALRNRRGFRHQQRADSDSGRGFQPDQVVGIGVDTTGSTPLPVDAQGRPLAFQKRFAKHPAAMAWLWKDHTGVAEAAEITEKARQMRPHYLAKCGGTYSSEWFFSKILHCRRTAPEVFDAAYTWVECADWVPAMLTGTEAPDSSPWASAPPATRRCTATTGAATRTPSSWARSIPSWASCAPGSGPKPGRWTSRWAASRPNGPRAPACRPASRWPSARSTRTWAGWARHRAGHAGQDHRHQHLRHDGRAGGPAVGGHPRPVRHRQRQHPARLLGPGGRPVGRGRHLQLVRQLPPAGRQEAGSHEELTKGAARLKPGESGLLALDWNNGNRTILVDQRLTGLLLGQTLYTTPAEIYRALIEATAFGALTIINRFEEYGVKVEQIINCGGIAEKNPLVMQIYADVTGRPMKVSRSAQTCALGAAIAGAVDMLVARRPIAEAACLPDKKWHRWTLTNYAKKSAAPIGSCWRLGW
jgi:L-ribulokinase